MANTSSLVAGVDVGARRLNCVWLDDRGDLVETAVVEVEEAVGRAGEAPAGKPGEVGGQAQPAPEFERTVDRLARAHTIAIDAPDSPLAEPPPHHAKRRGKFADARCAEVALGEEWRSWVPWVTPPLEQAQPWMRVGFELFRRLKDRGCRTIEVFPDGAFGLLAREAGLARFARKSTPKGSADRIRALRRLHHRVSLEMWSHDGLDALMAAEIALDHLHGHARRAPADPLVHELTHGCTYDQSAIWLPASLT